MITDCPIQQPQLALPALTPWLHRRIDKLVAKHTAFNDLWDLLHTGGSYRPTLDTSNNERRLIADAYDATQAALGDSRRAYRYQRATIKPLKPAPRLEHAS